MAAGCLKSPAVMRVVIEGNIGSGKSTILQGLVWKLNARVHPEPVAQWSHLLKRFYEEPASVAMDLHVRILVDFSKIPENDELHVVERCPVSTQHVFAAMAFQKGWLTDVQWSSFKEMVGALGWDPDAIVYVDTPTDVCFQRIQARETHGAEPTSQEYLEEIRMRYEALLKFTKVPVVRIDGSQPSDVVLQHAVDAIRTFAVDA